MTIEVVTFTGEFQTLSPRTASEMVHAWTLAKTLVSLGQLKRATIWNTDGVIRGEEEAANCAFTAQRKVA